MVHVFKQRDRLVAKDNYSTENFDTLFVYVGGLEQHRLPVLTVNDRLIFVFLLHLSEIF